MSDKYNMYSEWRDPRYAAADKEIDGLKALLIDLTPGGSEFHGSPERCAQWARDRISFTGKLAAERNRLRTAADALATKADKLLEHIEMGWSHGEECIALDDAVRKYREVSGG